MVERIAGPKCLSREREVSKKEKNVLQATANALVDESSAAQLGNKAVAKVLCKPALVVVEAEGVCVVDSSDIDDDSTVGEEDGIAGANERGLGVGREKAEEEYGERLVHVEGPTVGADDWRHADLL